MSTVVNITPSEWAAFRRVAWGSPYEISSQDIKAYLGVLARGGSAGDIQFQIVPKPKVAQVRLPLPRGSLVIQASWVPA